MGRMFVGEHDRGWYVDFRAPVRGPHWFELLDYGLDIVITPDGSWAWKDLDAGRCWWSAWDGWTPQARPWP